MEKFRFNMKSLKERRRELRKNQTEAEKILWEELRGKGLSGFKFYRQYSIGPYVVDFYCSKLRIAIELDGGHHNKPEIEFYDKERSVYFKSCGVQTIRLWNNEIVKNLDMVVTKINQIISNMVPPLS